MARFKPTPITMATRSSQPAIGTISASTPPSFCPSTKISFGHFNAISPIFSSKPPPQSRTAPTIASRISQPAIICSQPLTDKSRIIETGTLTTSDTMNDSPGTLVHVWSRRPRPAVCSFAAMTTISCPLHADFPAFTPSALLTPSAPFTPNSTPSRTKSAAYVFVDPTVSSSST